MVAVPSRKTDITAEWLTEALTEPFPGIRVTNMTLLDELHGSAAKMRIELTTEGATEPPRTVVVKTAFTEGLGDDELARSWISVMALLNETECRFYRDISAALGTRCPRYYYGSAQGEDSFIVMEDLTWRPGLRFGSFDKPLSPDDMADVLDVLAQLHSLRWDDEKLSREPIRDPTLAGGFLDGFLSATNWEQQMARPRAERVPQELSDYHTVTSAIRQAWAEKRVGPQCLIHGDPHTGNHFFDRDGAGLLDWQLFTSGHWASDIVYAMASAMDIEVRRENEQELLKHYLSQISVRTGAAPSWDSAWHDYRKFAIWGFISLLTPGEGIQTEEYNTVVSERHACAATDHDSITLLDK